MCVTSPCSELLLLSKWIIALFCSLTEQAGDGGLPQLEGGGAGGVYLQEVLQGPGVPAGDWTWRWAMLGQRTETQGEGPAAEAQTKGRPVRKKQGKEESRFTLLVRMISPHTQRLFSVDKRNTSLLVVFFCLFIILIILLQLIRIT